MTNIDITQVRLDGDSKHLTLEDILYRLSKNRTQSGNVDKSTVFYLRGIYQNFVGQCGMTLYYLGKYEAINAVEFITADNVVVVLKMYKTGNWHIHRFHQLYKSKPVVKKTVDVSKRELKKQIIVLQKQVAKLSELVSKI